MRKVGRKTIGSRHSASSWVRTDGTKYYVKELVREIAREIEKSQWVTLYVAGPHGGRIILGASGIAAYGDVRVR